jgi:sortase (surface protein transpeptidase)
MRRHNFRCPRWVVGVVAALFVALITGCAAPSLSATTTPLASLSQSTTTATAPDATTGTNLPPRGVTAPRAHVSQLARSVPLQVQIPAIAVDTALMSLGLKADRTLQVPPSGFPAGWYTGAVTPGEVGPAIIVGHIDWNGPAVFYRLRDLKPGDTITVLRTDGTKPRFRVMKVAQYPKDAFPTALVYGKTATPTLRLITCGGAFNTNTGHYEDNTVVFADLL